MERKSSRVLITIVVGLTFYLTSCTSTETPSAAPPPTQLPQAPPTPIPPEAASTAVQAVEPTTQPASTTEPIPFLPGGLAVIQPENAANLRRIATLTGPGCSVAAFSPDSRLLATGTFGEGAVILWDLATGQPGYTLRGHVDPRVLYYLAFSPDGGTLISGAQGWDAGNDSMILWDVASGEQIRSFNGRPGALSSDWRILAISTTRGREGDTLTLFNLDTGDVTGTVTTEKEILGVSFSYDDRVLTTRLREIWRSPIVLWNMETLREIRWLYDWHFFTFSPSNNRIAAIIDDGGDTDKGELKVFNMDDWPEDKVLASEADALWYVLPTFSPDGRLLTASFGDQLRVWNTETWEELNRLEIPEKSGVAFSPDGRILATFSYNQTVQLWGVVP